MDSPWPWCIGFVFFYAIYVRVNLARTDNRLRRHLNGHRAQDKMAERSKFY